MTRVKGHFAFRVKTLREQALSVEHRLLPQEALEDRIVVNEASLIVRTSEAARHLIVDVTS